MLVGMIASALSVYLSLTVPSYGRMLSLPMHYPINWLIALVPKPVFEIMVVVVLGTAVPSAVVGIFSAWAFHTVWSPHPTPSPQKKSK